MEKMQYSPSGCTNSPGSQGKRGHVLSIDAAFSIIILIALIGIMSYFPLMESKNPYAKLNMQRSMNDALDLLDAQKILQNFDGNEIAQAVNETMPVQYSWKMRIGKYSYANDEFSREAELNFGAADANFLAADVMHGRRLFLTFEDNEIEYFYDAEYWVWVGK